MVKSKNMTSGVPPPIGHPIGGGTLLVRCHAVSLLRNRRATNRRLHLMLIPLTKLSQAEIDLLFS